MPETIKQILMRRDGLTANEADELISDAQDALYQYLKEGDLYSAEHIFQEYFGLGPDYLFD